MHELLCACLPEMWCHKLEIGDKTVCKKERRKRR